MGATRSTRDRETSLMYQRLETGKLRVLQGYVDADYAGDLDQRKSMTSCMFTVAECVNS